MMEEKEGEGAHTHTANDCWAGQARQWSTLLSSKHSHELLYSR